jgi:hypothetical protein
MLAALTLISAPAFAQQGEQRQDGRGGHERSHQGQGSSGRSEGQARPRAEASAPRADAGRQAVAARPESRTEAVAPRVETRRDGGGQRGETRREGVGPRGDVRRDESFQRAVPRREVIAPRRGYSPRYQTRYVPRYGYGVRSYYRPYVYRPRLSIGFGIFAGYPAPYTYRYAYPIRVYGYRAPVAPVYLGSAPIYGGVALEMSPYDADVYVDGTLAGRVEDFDGSTQPLTLVPGTHRIEVQADGFVPLTFDVAVQAGQVIPYRGDLQPY